MGGDTLRHEHETLIGISYEKTAFASAKFGRCFP